MFYINVIDMQIYWIPFRTDDFGSWFIKKILGVLD